MVRRLFRKDPLAVTFGAGMLVTATAWLVLYGCATLLETLTKCSIGYGLVGGLYAVGTLVGALTGCVALPTFPWCVVKTMRGLREHNSRKVVIYAALALLSISMASLAIFYVAVFVGVTSRM